MYLSTLVVLLVSLRGQASPVHSENEAFTYQDSEEFKREISEKIEVLHKNEKKSVFDRILTVNSVHKRWKAKTRLEKRNVNADDLINTINMENDNVFFEGDIVLEDDQLLDIEKTESFRRKRNAVHKRKQIWITRKIPYYIDPELSFQARSAIQQAMAIIHEKTCVRWVPYTSTAQKHYVHIKKGDGCFSVIGRAYAEEGGQVLSIGEGCETVPVVLHELTHCMGFFHEQSRDDRGKYIKILWENIPVAYQDQFAKYSHGVIDKMNKDYDIRSLMHYSATAFGDNGKTTIVSLDPSKPVGAAVTYTELDIIEINALYNCKTSSNYQRISSWSDWSECDEKHCYKERQRFCFSRNKADCPKANAYGIETEYAKCPSTECPARIDGNWAMWSSWGACSKSCDEGVHRRTRICNNPVPSNGGKTCIGERIDVSTCLNRRCRFGKYDADFEDGWGMWFSPTNRGLLPWARISSFTKTMNTGPRGDHTLQGRGSYVYVESSNHKKGDKAWLASKILEFPTPQCTSFYYSMYGKLIGSLTLYIAPEGKKWIKLFMKSGNQGPNWQNADVTLDYKGKFQLVFEVVLGGRGYSDTALDDIFIDNKACPGYVACKDDNINCPSWANNKQCKENPNYMLASCKLSCRVCRNPYAYGPNNPAPKTLLPAPKKCVDENPNCFSWSAGGYCQQSPEYMHVNCKASCGLCGDCENLETSINCDTWAKQGKCSTEYKSFMMTNCKQSCTGCTKPCEDDNVECPNWANNGECNVNPSWMGANCRKSCKKC